MTGTQTYRVTATGRGFNTAVRELRELGGKFDRASKTWAIDPDYYVVQMYVRHAREYNAAYPERDPQPTEPLAVIADRLRNLAAPAPANDRRTLVPAWGNDTEDNVRYWLATQE